MIDGGQETQEDISPNTTTMDTMRVTKGNKIMKFIFIDFVPLMHTLSFSL